MIRILHVELAVKILTNGQCIVLGRFGQHSIAPVGADQVETARRLAFKTIQRSLPFP